MFFPDQISTFHGKSHIIKTLATWPGGMSTNTTSATASQRVLQQGTYVNQKNYGQDENKPKIKVLELRKSCLWTFIAGWMMRYTGRTATKYTGVGDEMCHRLPPNSSNQFCETHVWTNSFIWLVVYLPLWKIWLRQLGWLFTIWWKVIKFMFQTTNQSYILDDTFMCPHSIPLVNRWKRWR